MGSNGVRVDLVHGILWSKYKAGVFSEMHRLAGEHGFSFKFYQVAETDADRIALSGVDVSRHEYPFTLLFKGAYSSIPASVLARRLFWIVYKSDAELILLPGFSEVSHWAMLLAAMLSGKKRAVFCDSTLRDRKQSWLKGLAKRTFFRLCNGYFTYGARGREYLEHYGAHPARIHQRVQAAALPSDYSVDGARRSRLEAMAASRHPIFLYVGRLSPEKSLDVLIRAFHIVSKKQPTSRLRIVGGGPRRDDLIALSDSLGLIDRIEFVGGLEMEKLVEEYSKATCLVLPSRSEPWGLVVNEAMHYGCPVVVSDNCGCVPELVHDNQTGFIFRTDDVADLSEKLVLVVNELHGRQRVADRCLELIGQYVPTRAASQTLAGCAAILGVARTRS